MFRISHFAVISVMGPHAGEDCSTIFQRKIEDISKLGKTFWLFHSQNAKPEIIQAMCTEATCQNESVFCLFIEPASFKGVIPTKLSIAASQYFSDRSTWFSLPEELGPVTGQINNTAFALVFDQLDLQNTDAIDLWKYADYSRPEEPLVFRQGASTLCAVKKDTSSHPKKLDSHLRAVVAIGRLSKPYAVWLR